MDSNAVLVSVSLAGAFFAGLWATFGTAAHTARRGVQGKIRSHLGMKTQLLPLQTRGFIIWFLCMAARASRLARQADTHAMESNAASGRRAHARYATRIVQAGLADAVTLQGVLRARNRCCVAFAAVGALVGMCFTPALAAVGGAGGALAGVAAASRAITAQVAHRKQELEGNLSQTIEVICLGLRAGLSFDRSLALYCKSFAGSFTRELEQCMHLWQTGIVSREQALRNLAATYDSVLLQRVVDNIVRSLRFGSPLADSLEVLAAESRQAHTARVQEAVMKAPVKMMVPVGTLILPSMLILVLGPVLLDLMNGF